MVQLFKLSANAHLSKVPCLKSRGRFSILKYFLSRYIFLQIIGVIELSAKGFGAPDGDGVYSDSIKKI